MCRLYCEKCGRMDHSTQHHDAVEEEELQELSEVLEGTVDKIARILEIRNAK